MLWAVESLSSQGYLGGHNFDKEQCNFQNKRPFIQKIANHIW